MLFYNGFIVVFSMALFFLWVLWYLCLLFGNTYFA